MKTKRLISTISYNSEGFLTHTLNKLVSSEVLEYWFAILHQPEEDETKAHYHVIMLPCGSIDTHSLRREFDEVEEGSDIPLGCMPIRVSKSFDDWYLYAVHHRGYLMWKCETRAFHYSFDDFLGSDLDLLREMVSEISLQQYRCYEEIFLAVERQVPFSSIVASGLVPLNYMTQFKILYECLVNDRAKVYRGARLVHETLSSHEDDGFSCSPFN